jgi:hypothetical protein
VGDSEATLLGSGVGFGTGAWVVGRLAGSTQKSAKVPSVSPPIHPGTGATKEFLS